jgi:Cys-tRNA(Pro) deacylase
VKPTDRVRVALQAGGVATEVVEFPHSTRTAADAAAVVGTTVGQIVKSLVFVADRQPVLVLTSGANRVDAGKLARAARARRVEKAAADVVRDVTGFAIGGVPPVGHARPLPVYIDRDLLDFEIVYAAAGTPTSVFPIAPAALQRITAGAVVDLREETQEKTRP